MNAEFQLSQITRKNIQDAIKGLSNEQLNEIPKGFNNNLIWNVGHIIVTQCLLLYGLCRHDLPIEDELVNSFRKGTFPKQPVDESTVKQICKLLTSVPEQVQKDYQDGKFEEFRTYETSYGAKLQSAEDAIRFNNMHESMHLGTMLSLLKLV